MKYWQTGGLETATAASNPCKHETGWYVKVSFWIFDRRYFVCSDCGKLIPDSKWGMFV